MVTYEQSVSHISVNVCSLQTPKLNWRSNPRDREAAALILRAFPARAVQTTKVTCILRDKCHRYDTKKYEWDLLEKTQCRALRDIQGLSARTHNSIARGLIGQLSMRSLIYRMKLSFLSFIRTINLASSVLFKYMCAYRSIRYCVIWTFWPHCLLQ